MNIFLINIFFSFISFIIFEYIVSFAKFEIKKNGNVLGSIFLILFCIFSIIFSNYVFWSN